MGYFYFSDKSDFRKLSAASTTYYNQIREGGNTDASTDSRRGKRDDVTKRHGQDRASAGTDIGWAKVLRNTRY